VTDLRGALKPAPRVKHMAALQAGELSGFMAKLRQYNVEGGDFQTQLAIELVMRTFIRTNELRFGKWSEIDCETWRIPAERIKMRREHIVPLSGQSLALLSKLKGIAAGSAWIVPGLKDQPISENTLLFACYRMGYRGRVTIHGMRSLDSSLKCDS
jgi:integrase